MIQLFDGANVALIDPLGISDWSPLKAVLRDTGITKFLHAGSEDLEVFLNAFGELPEPLIDTQILAAFAGVRCRGVCVDGRRVYGRGAG